MPLRIQAGLLPPSMTSVGRVMPLHRSMGSGRPLNALDSTDLFRTGAYPITARPFDLARNPFFQSGTVSLDLRLMKIWWVVPSPPCWILTFSRRPGEAAPGSRHVL